MKISFELFPPKTPEQTAQLDQALPELLKFKPEYFSVTFGAGGSTLSYTAEVAQRIKLNHAVEVAPHLSCMGGTRAEIKVLLDHYKAIGCTRIVALRGDMPSGMASVGEFRYANELVEFIRAQSGDQFQIEVACYPEIHPQANNAQSDLVNLKRKIDAGANGAITQYFYSADGYFRFVEEARKIGVNVPIVPGIMPISNYTQLQRFSDMCGAEIPRWMAKRLQGFGDDSASIREFGADVVAKLCRDLTAGGAPSFHFYTLNRAKATQAIMQRLQS